MWSLTGANLTSRDEVINCKKSAPGAKSDPGAKNPPLGIARGADGEHLLGSAFLPKKASENPSSIKIFSAVPAPH